MHTVFALLCFVVVIHWLIFPYPSGLLHNNCPSASKATLMNMDKYFMWIHYERLHNHNKAKHNKTVCIFLGIYCILSWQRAAAWYDRVFTLEIFGRSNVATHEKCVVPYRHVIKCAILSYGVKHQFAIWNNMRNWDPFQLTHRMFYCKMACSRSGCRISYYQGACYISKQYDISIRNLTDWPQYIRCKIVWSVDEYRGYVRFYPYKIFHLSYIITIVQSMRCARWDGRAVNLVCNNLYIPMSNVYYPHSANFLVIYAINTWECGLLK